MRSIVQKCGGFFKQATVVECNDLNEPLTEETEIGAAQKGDFEQ